MLIARSLPTNFYYQKFSFAAIVAAMKQNDGFCFISHSVFPYSDFVKNLRNTKFSA
jgi:hypothetical protein